MKREDSAFKIKGLLNYSEMRPKKLYFLWELKKLSKCEQSQHNYLLPLKWNLERREPSNMSSQARAIIFLKNSTLILCFKANLCSSNWSSKSSQPFSLLEDSAISLRGASVLVGLGFDHPEVKTWGGEAPCEELLLSLKVSGYRVDRNKVWSEPPF